MTTLTQRSHVIALVSDAIAAGARQDRACGAISLSERTLQRWQQDQCRGDLRPMRVQATKNSLSTSERQALLAVANSDEFADLAPSQISPAWPTRGITSPPNRAFTACSRQPINFSTVALSGPDKSAASPAR